MFPECKCFMMEAYAQTPTSPVTFDEQLEAFTLTDETPLLHCFHCGGRLPKPKYADPVDPDPKQEAEAIAIVQSSASFDELVERLGTPDDSKTYAEFSTGFVEAFDRIQQRHPEVYVSDPTYKWVRYARYVKRWPGMVLDVYEYPDGRLESSVTGLPTGSYAIVEPRTWWRRLLGQMT